MNGELFVYTPTSFSFMLLHLIQFYLIRCLQKCLSRIHVWLSRKKDSLRALCVRFHLPFNACNEEDEVAVDFGAVDEFINVACIHCLSCLQAARPYAITHCGNKHTIIYYSKLL